jgi:hypothetical protein
MSSWTNYFNTNVQTHMAGWAANSVLLDFGDARSKIWDVITALGKVQAWIGAEPDREYNLSGGNGNDPLTDQERALLSGIFTGAGITSVNSFHINSAMSLMQNLDSLHKTIGDTQYAGMVRQNITDNKQNIETNYKGQPA